MNSETSTLANKPQNEPLPTQFRLQSAFLVRYLTDGQKQQFILEDVATRKRRRFEDLETLQAWLQEIFANS